MERLSTFLRIELKAHTLTSGSLLALAGCKKTEPDDTMELCEPIL
jgi:hypothetical protein